MKAITKMILAALLVCTPGAAIQAQATSDKSGLSHWYVGIDGGIPFAFSTFQSISSAKTYIGFGAGLFGGYRFSKLLSAELSARLGETTMGATDCCIQSDYWLGQNGERYHSPALGFEGWDYQTLKNKVMMQDYSLQFNINLLALLSRSRQSKWAVEISPRIGLFNTQTDIKTIDDDVLHIKGGYRWHFASGGRIQVSRMLGRHFQVGAYTGMSFLTGNHIDNMPKHIHKSNYVWDSGIRLSYTFSRCHKTSSPVTEVQPVIEQPVPTHVVPVDTVAETPVVEQPSIPVKTDTVTAFPVIYFDFNKSGVRPSEFAKMNEILSKMQQCPEMKIVVEGWCDSHGSDAYNNPLSLRRADSVKRWLVGKGIAADRIKTTGYGIDRNQTDSSNARHAVVTVRKEETR